MRSVFVLLVLVAVALAGLFALLLVVSPSGPTGYATAPPTDLQGNTLIRAEQLDALLGLAPVRITVEGDIVWPIVLVDGEPQKLSGRWVDGQWLSGPATIIVRLEPGEHVIAAHSCVEKTFGYECGCLNPDNCGNWMQRSVRVD